MYLILNLLCPRYVLTFDDLTSFNEQLYHPSVVKYEIKFQDIHLGIRRKQEHLRLKPLLELLATRQERIFIVVLVELPPLLHTEFNLKRVIARRYIYYVIPVRKFLRPLLTIDGEN